VKLPRAGPGTETQHIQSPRDSSCWGSQQPERSAYAGVRKGAAGGFFVGKYKKVGLWALGAVCGGAVSNWRIKKILIKIEKTMERYLFIWQTAGGSTRSLVKRGFENGRDRSGGDLVPGRQLLTVRQLAKACTRKKRGDTFLWMGSNSL